MSKPHNGKPLNELATTEQRIPVFAAEYVANGGNRTEAAIKAGVSKTSAAVWASKALRNNKVFPIIESSLRAKIKRIDARGDRVITELFRILTVDIKDAFHENGALKSIHDIPEELRRAIAGFEVEEIWDYPDGDRDQPKIVVGELKKVKFWSKTESANLLGKHLKLWAEAAGIELFVDGDVEMPLTIKT